jgi:hypothetical protein
VRAVLACAAKVVGPAGARNLQAPWRQAGSEGDIALPHFPSKPRGFEGIKYNTCFEGACERWRSFCAKEPKYYRNWGLILAERAAFGSRHVS